MANYNLSQTIRFLLVGSTTFMIDIALLLTLAEYLGVYYLFSAAIAFLIASIINYLLSILVVFKTGRHKNKKKEFIYFLLFTSVGVILNHSVIYFCTNTFMINLFISKSFSTVIVTIFNFLTKKHFVFLD